MIDRLPHEKGFHVSWDQIHRDARALAWRLDGKGPDNGAWKAVVGITRGGLVPAMIVSRELDIRVVDTISVKSYSHQAQTEARVIKSPQADLMGDGTGILIVDDLVDSGKTLELVRKLYPQAHFATVYAKPSGRPQVDTYITEVSQDTWIFFPWDMALQYVQQCCQPCLISTFGQHIAFHFTVFCLLLRRFVKLLLIRQQRTAVIYRATDGG